MKSFAAMAATLVLGLTIGIGDAEAAKRLGGGKSAGMQRQALHAFRLGFLHPVTAKPLQFHANLPADFSNALVDWGLQYNMGNL